MKLSLLRVILIVFSVSFITSLLFIYFITGHHNNRLFLAIEQFYSELDSNIHNAIAFVINTDGKTIVQYDTMISTPIEMLKYIRSGLRSPKDIELMSIFPLGYKKTATKCCFLCKIFRTGLNKSVYQIEQFFNKKNVGITNALFIFIENQHLIVHFTNSVEDIKYELYVPVLKGSSVTRKLLLWYFRRSLTA